jgi:hypothetical protein
MQSVRNPDASLRPDPLTGVIGSYFKLSVFPAFTAYSWRTRRCRDISSRFNTK